MDPDANLEEQRRLVKSLIDLWDACPESGEPTEDQKAEAWNDGIRLAELVQALDSWITGLGPLPDTWEKQ